MFIKQQYELMIIIQDLLINYSCCGKFDKDECIKLNLILSKVQYNKEKLTTIQNYDNRIKVIISETKLINLLDIYEYIQDTRKKIYDTILNNDLFAVIFDIERYIKFMYTVFIEDEATEREERERMKERINNIPYIKYTIFN